MKKNNRIWITAISIAVFLVLGDILPAPAFMNPMEAVQQTVDSVIRTLKDKTLDRENLRKKVLTLIAERFDFALMARKTLARSWRKATPEERERFTHLFTKLLEFTYMDRISAYTGERVRYVKEKVKGKRALVDTLIVTKNKEIPVRYKLVSNKGEWRVYDVVIEEVSLIRNYRSSYREIVQRHGIEELLARMEDKINGLKLNQQAGESK